MYATSHNLTDMLHAQNLSVTPDLLGMSPSGTSQVFCLPGPASHVASQDVPGMSPPSTYQVCLLQRHVRYTVSQDLPGAASQDLSLAPSLKTC